MSVFRLQDTGNLTVNLTMTRTSGAAHTLVSWCVGSVQLNARMRNRAGRDEERGASPDRDRSPSPSSKDASRSRKDARKAERSRKVEPKGKRTSKDRTMVRMVV